MHALMSAHHPNTCILRHAFTTWANTQHIHVTHPPPSPHPLHPTHPPTHPHQQVMRTAKQRQTTHEAKAKAGERLGGRSRVALVSDRHYLDFLPLVIGHYGRALCCGCAHVYQALPRLLTLWFQIGSTAASKHTRVSKSVRSGGAWV